MKKTNVKLYYIVSLHQTTTGGGACPAGGIVLYRFSTSNHNKNVSKPSQFLVVLYRFSTSNHNHTACMRHDGWLYYIVSLHQTTTKAQPMAQAQKLYYIVSLHQTTTQAGADLNGDMLYYIVSLHQTTTACPNAISMRELYYIVSLHQTTTA